MVVLLVFLTVAVFIAADLYYVRRRRRDRDLAWLDQELRAEVGANDGPVPDLFFHPGHTWVRRARGDLATVGTSDFAANFAGELAAIELPAPGTRLRQGAPVWTLVSKKGRRLTQVMPVDGTVLAVNDALTKDPALTLSSPYGVGWILRTRTHARRARTQLRSLMQGLGAELWLKSGLPCITARMSPALGRVAHDGGEWRAAFGDLLDAADWLALRDELFPNGIQEHATDR